MVTRGHDVFLKIENVHSNKYKTQQRKQKKLKIKKIEKHKKKFNGTVRHGGREFRKKTDKKPKRAEGCRVIVRSLWTWAGM